MKYFLICTILLVIVIGGLSIATQDEPAPATTQQAPSSDDLKMKGFKLE